MTSLHSQAYRERMPAAPDSMRRMVRAQACGTRFICGHACGTRFSRGYYLVDRLGAFWFSVPSSSLAEAGAGTAALRTMSLALTSFP